jgi:hypothetical protein
MAAGFAFAQLDLGVLTCSFVLSMRLSVTLNTHVRFFIGSLFLVIDLHGMAHNTMTPSMHVQDSPKISMVSVQLPFHISLSVLIRHTLTFSVLSLLLVSNY